MIHVTSFTEANGHAVNEDAFSVEQHPLDAECWVCCLADGQGGRAGGAVAARLAVDTAVQAALKLSPQDLFYGRSWMRLLTLADVAVMNDADAGGTTLIGFCLREKMLVGASCGDSAVMVAVAGESSLRDVTAGQHKNHPVGSGDARFVSFTMPLQPPRTVLAMSDGVWKYSGTSHIVECLAAERGQSLIDAIQRPARLPGSGRFQGDFTLVVFEDDAPCG